MAESPSSIRRGVPRAAAISALRRTFRVRRRSDGAPPSPRMGVRRAIRLAGAGLLGIAAILAIAWLAILYMPLPASQLVPRVQGALQSRLGPTYAVTIADAELHRGGDGVGLRLVDLAIAKAGGSNVAEAARVELRLDGMSLLTGEIKVRSAHVLRPRLDMRFDETVGAASEQADLPLRILGGVADLDRLLGPDGAAGALQQVEVEGAVLQVASGKRAPVTLDGVDLRLSRTTSGALALTAASARADDRWSSAVTVSPGPDGRGRVIDLGLENVALGPYAAPFAERAGAPPIAGRLSGHLNAQIGADGRLNAGDGRLALRDLSVTPPGGAPLVAETVQLELGWDPLARTLTIEPSRIAGQGGQMNFSGSIAAPGGGRTAWAVTLDGRDALLAAERPGEAPLRLDRVVVEAGFDPGAGVLEVTKAQVLGPTAKAALTGVVRFEGESPGVRLGLVSEPMPASAAKRLWPPFVAGAIRRWAVENVRGGTVESLSLTLDIPSGALDALGPYDPLPPGSMALEVTFSDASLRGKPGLPWIEGASGRVVATSRQVLGTIGRGVIPQPSGPPLTLSDVRFEVPDTAPRFQPAKVTFRADGPLDPAMTLLTSGAVGANPLPPQLDAAKVAGKVAANVTVGFELGHAAGDEPKAAVDVYAALDDVTVADVFAGKSFERGTFKVTSSGGATDVSGKGRLGGAAATVSVVEIPATDSAPRRRNLKATVTADAGDLTRLGLDVPGVLRGALPIEATMPLDQPGAPIMLTADLKSVGIDGVAPGFRKPAGQPGRLSFLVEKGAERTLVKDFALESGDRSIRGTLAFGPKGELLSATLPIYRPAPGDDARVEIDKTRSGAVKVAVQGAALDLKPLLDAFRGKKAGEQGGAPSGASKSGAMPKTLDVTAKLGTGLGYGGEALAGLELKLAMRDGKVTDAEGAARLGRGAIKVTTADDGRLRLTGEDAGAFFRLADLYGRIDGGVYDLSASLVGGPGTLRVRDFSVRNDDALAQVQVTTGADRQAQRAGATRFDRLRVAFVEGRGKIDIQEATLYGPQLGATLDGVVDYSADQVSLVGTFVPAYALNNLFARVPIIGALLGGGKEGGLVGVTFQVKGRTGAPVVTVNPVSAVAPGFLRKMFEFRQSGADTTSSTSQPTNDAQQ